jgi:DNA-binding NarL/FixJ family response regulator
MLEAGVDGYLLKNTTRDEIVEAIVTVYRGGNFFTLDTQVQRVTKDYFMSKDVASASSIKLTDQEQMVLTYICQEMSTKEIASAMEIGVRTVETYKKRIMEKVGAKSMAGLVAYAVLKGEVRV